MFFGGMGLQGHRGPESLLSQFDSFFVSVCLGEHSQVNLPCEMFRATFSRFESIFPLSFAKSSQSSPGFLCLIVLVNFSQR